MIPKIIYFIWIGDKPIFVNTSIKEYLRLNLDFKIKLIFYSIKEIENIYFKKIINSDVDKVCFDVIDNILNKSGNYYKFICKLKKILSKTSNISFILLFCDIFRLALLNMTGGIYIDCDTYPIKPFDLNLLLYDRFIVYDKMTEYFSYPNNYFIGSSGKCNWYDYFDGSAYKIIQTNNFNFIKMNKNKPIDYLLRRAKFFTGLLNAEDMNRIKYKENYFEHYSDFRWGRQKIPITKFDNFLNY